MKVALVFFGQPRFLENPLPLQTHKEKIIDKYDTDVFCHTWWSKSHNDYQTSSWSTINSCPVDDQAIEKIIKFYNPKSLKYQDSTVFDLSDKPNFKRVTSIYDWALINRNNLCSHLFSFTEAGKLLEDYSRINNKKYDFIVASRLDANIIRFPDLEKLDPNKLFLPNHHDKFPDNLFLFGSKFINFFNIFPHIEELSHKVWQPSAEAFKWENYKKFYPEDPFIQHYNVYSEFVRSN